MADAAIITRAEKERQAGLSFTGKTVNVMLCGAPDVDITLATVAEWQAAEVVNDGYVRFSQAMPAGEIIEPNGIWQSERILASFTADAPGLTYSYVVTYFTGETDPYSYLPEDPAITLAPGQIQRYGFYIRIS